MDRRLILALGIAALVSGLGIAACGPAPSGGQPTGVPATSGASASSGVTAPAGATASPVVGGPAATCVGTPRLVAVRATAPSTGFPVPVEWIGLGPAADTFFTLSDVAPRIAIDPLGPASITIGLQYISASGDRYALTGGSVTLAYDPATGRVSGSLDTGYGKNTNRATTDTVASEFDGVYTHGPNPGSGVLEGTITHPARETYRFKVAMVELRETLLEPGCASPRPTDTL
jgi:hypothetical protein